jgi:hypothetical protein
MVEDSFRRMEQQQQPPRKKKRTSDGTGTGTAKTPKSTSSRHTPTAPNGISERRFVDAGVTTSRSKSISPPLMNSFVKKRVSRHGSAAAPSRQPSAPPRPNYCDASVQTDPVEGEWYSDVCPTPKPRRRIISLSKRLLENRHRIRLDEEEKHKTRESPTPNGTATSMDLDSPTNEHKSLPEHLPSTNDASTSAVPSPTMANGTVGDIAMPDAPLVSPTDAKRPPVTAKIKSPDLRVQMPPVPGFGSPTSGISASTTPLSANSPIVHSPFAMAALHSPFGPPAVNGVAANPSPVKKKMSLSDYKSRMSKTSKPTLGTTMLKPPSSNGDEPKSATSVDLPGSADSPTADKAMDVMAETPTPAAASPTIVSASGPM